MKKILFILVLVLGIGGVSVAQTAQTQPSKEYVVALKKIFFITSLNLKIFTKENPVKNR